MSEQQPTEEELREALKALRVEDILIQTVVTLVNVAGRKLTVDEEKDPEQAKLAIDSVRALLPQLPEEETGPIRDALSQLQMVFVRETQQPESTEDRGQRTEPEPESKPESRIWTPGS